MNEPEMSTLDIYRAAAEAVNTSYQPWGKDPNRHYGGEHRQTADKGKKARRKKVQASRRKNRR